MAQKETIIRGVEATSNIDRRGDVFLPEALEEMARQANGPETIRRTVEHDRTLPPWGKVLRAWIERGENGEVRLLSESVMFDDPQEIILPDGTIAGIQSTTLDVRPFAGSNQDSSLEMDVAIDLANFPIEEEAQAFLTQIRADAGVPFNSGFFIRKSFVLPPEIIIALAKPLALLIGGLAPGKKLLDKTGDKVSQSIASDLDKFYKLVRSVVINTVKHMYPKNRPVTYVFTAAGEPQITFVARTEKGEAVIAATKIEIIADALVGAAAIHQQYDTREIQYLLEEDGKWHFNYLLTKTGAVIGSKASFSRRTHQLALLNQVKGHGDAVQVEADVSEPVAITIASSPVAIGQGLSFGGAYRTPPQMTQEQPLEQIVGQPNKAEH